MNRADRRRAHRDAHRYLQERYKAHRKYSAAQLRQILIEDAVARRVTPMAWMMGAIAAISEAEKISEERVFAQVRTACVEATGLDMPFGSTL